MKKQLLLAAFLMGGFFTASAQQTTVLSEDFEGDIDAIFESWSAFDLDGDEEAYGVYTANASLTALGFTGRPAGSPNFTVVDDAPVLTENSDNAFATPFLEIPADEPANISFRIGGAMITEGASAHYDVLVVTQTEMATIEDLPGFIALLDSKTAINTADITADGSSVKDVDLSSFAGETIGVIFRHSNNTGMAYLFFDDVVVTSGTLGTQQVIASNFSVFPNPATDVVNVANVQGLNAIQIVDLNGRTVKSVNFAGVSEASVNVSDLTAGVYMMNIATEKGTSTQKIVKK